MQSVPLGQVGFCSSTGMTRAYIDMFAVGFCSFGGSNNPVCFSYVQHQTEGEKIYKVAFFKMQQTVMAVLKANMDKDCEFIYLPQASQKL
jgi:hypothetical protein